MTNHSKLLTLARDLTRRKARDKQRMFVAEGIRAVEELVRSGIETVGALVAPQVSGSPRGAALVELLTVSGIDIVSVSEREFASAAATESPQGVLAVGVIPERSIEQVISNLHTLHLLVLDGVQDPGNVGTILRTAAALGVDGTVALPGTVDFWNPKVVRGAMGALFNHPTFHTTLDGLLPFLAGLDCELWGADASGAPLDRIVPDSLKPQRLALFVGNEGAGLSGEVLQKMDQTVAIPISSTVESLNVAVATGILLYGLRK